jgi:hypothetical protein
VYELGVTEIVIGAPTKVVPRPTLVTVTLGTTVMVVPVAAAELSAARTRISAPREGATWSEKVPSALLVPLAMTE